MVSGRTADQLVVIVGPTASGKSELAVNIAQAFNGEIISADSRTIYKGLDIGTAKPTFKDRAGIPHYGFDLIEPNETFSAAQFQQLANTWITNIQSRGKLPIVVGGSGLYVDSILFNYTFGKPVDSAFRHMLESLRIDELWDYCTKNNIELPENKKNKRYVIRAIEQGGLNRRRNTSVRTNTFVVGLNPGKEVLKQRIQQRATSILNKSVVKEASKVAELYGWQTPALNGNIYPIIRRLLENELTAKEAVELSATKDWQLAKRQIAWFKRNSFVHWYASIEQGYHVVGKYLSNFQ